LKKPHLHGIWTGDLHSILFTLKKYKFMLNKEKIMGCFSMA